VCAGTRHTALGGLLLCGVQLLARVQRGQQLEGEKGQASKGGIWRAIISLGAREGTALTSCSQHSRHTCTRWCSIDSEYRQAIVFAST